MTRLEGSTATLARLLARTPKTHEIFPNQWKNLADEIVAIAKASSGLILLHGCTGCGKTTFTAKLSDFARHDLDIITVSPASLIENSGWLLKALTPWLSSGPAEMINIQKNLASLAETDRPILIIADGGNFIDDTKLRGDVASLLNLADLTGIQISIVVLASEEKMHLLLSDDALAGKVMMHRQLPGLPTQNIAELLKYKLTHSSANASHSGQLDIAELASRSGGNPLLAFQLVAQELGLPMPTRSIGPKGVKARKNSNPQKAREVQNLDLEDLLTPNKSRTT
jgi:hypothetical protein